MSAPDKSIRDLLTDPKRRRDWIHYQLKLRGLTMAELARRHGVTRTCVYMAMLRPYPRMERIVAQELGMSPQELFPDRYDAGGRPNRLIGRPSRKVSDQDHTGDDTRAPRDRGNRGRRR